MTINREGEWKIEGLEVTQPMDSQLYLVLEPMVNQAASQEWRGVTAFELEDVAQAVWVDVMEHWTAYEGADDDLRFYMARRAARAFCKAQRVEYMYANGAFLYTPGVVRRMLEETVFCDPAHAIDVDARADITEAMAHLSKPQRAAIFKKFALKEPLSSPERNAESRAITNITHRLNTGLRLQPVFLED